MQGKPKSLIYCFTLTAILITSTNAYTQGFPYGGFTPYSYNSYNSYNSFNLGNPYGYVQPYSYSYNNWSQPYTYSYNNWYPPYSNWSQPYNYSYNNWYQPYNNGWNQPYVSYSDPWNFFNMGSPIEQYFDPYTTLHITSDGRSVWGRALNPYMI